MFDFLKLWLSLGLVLSVIVPNFAFSQNETVIDRPQIASDSSQVPTESHSRGFLFHTKSTLTDGFDSTGFKILGIGALATAFAFTQDQNVHADWKNHQRMSQGISRVGDYWGTGVPEALMALGQIYFDPDKGWPHAEALLAATIVTHSTKIVTGRPRPDSETRTSFPSGHTQAAFTSATAMWMSYGWKVGAPLTGMAILTGLSRLSDNAHWLSDVVAGATVGIFFGRAAYKHHLALIPLHADESRQHRWDGLMVRVTLPWDFHR